MDLRSAILAPKQHPSWSTTIVPDARGLRHDRSTIMQMTILTGTV
jgi:hypothetical protein